MKFTFAPVVDGDEYPVVERSFDHAASAIAHGAEVLRLVIEPVRPATAYVAVFEGTVSDGRSLGAWDWSTDVPEPVWSVDS